MTDREKLIELIQSAVDGCATYWAGLIADHLIAHGVTLQEHDCFWATEQAYKNGYEAGKPKWIPVTERLPDTQEYDWVLAQITLKPDCIYGVPGLLN